MDIIDILKSIVPAKGFITTIIKKYMSAIIKYNTVRHNFLNGINNLDIDKKIYNQIEKKFNDYEKEVISIFIKKD